MSVETAGKTGYVGGALITPEAGIYGKKTVNGVALFIKELFLTAEHDTPYEISQWCKTPFCKNICSYFGIDVNTYRKKMVEASLKNNENKNPVKPRNREEEEELCAEEEQELKYGPLFCYNNSAC